MSRNSFINRKRPAIESQVEDLLGPASQLDEFISGTPLPTAQETKAGDEEELNWKSKNKPG